MKKYIVKYKGSEKTFGEYSGKEEASKKIMAYINDCNEDLDEDYISPFDFELEEVECNDVNEVITDFESARRALGVKLNNDYILVSRGPSENDHEDIERLVGDINPKHLEALIALNELFTIAEAWNKEDGFVPYFSDASQYKWLPWFEYNNDTAKFVCKSASYTSTYVDATFGHRLCFKTEERAKQFGEQFADLYNKVFLSK